MSPKYRVAASVAASVQPGASLHFVKDTGDSSPEALRGSGFVEVHQAGDNQIQDDKGGEDEYNHRSAEMLSIGVDEIA